VARGSSITLVGQLNTNLAGTLKFVVDGDEANASSVNMTIPGTNASVSQKVNLDNMGQNDGKVHEADYQFVAKNKVLSSTKFYFIVGNQLELNVPQSIDFGSHKSMDFLNGFSADPTVDGQLTLFDGRNSGGNLNYSGNLGLSATATEFKNNSGDKLNAELYWNKALIPTSGGGVKVGELTPPTSAEPSFKNFTQDVKNNLKLETPAGTSPKGGQYTSEMTWTVNDTIQ